MPTRVAAGKCCSNIRTDDLDLYAPKELLNLDVLHKRSTGRLIETIPYGRFGSSERKFFGDDAIKRSNHSLPSRLFLDPCDRVSKTKKSRSWLRAAWLALSGLTRPSKCPHVETGSWRAQAPRDRQQSVVRELHDEPLPARRRHDVPCGAQLVAQNAGGAVRQDRPAEPRALKVHRARGRPLRAAAQAGVLARQGARPVRHGRPRQVDDLFGRCVASHLATSKPACGPPVARASRITRAPTDRSLALSSPGYYGGMGTASKNKPLWNTYSLSGSNKPL